MEDASGPVMAGVGCFVMMVGLVGGPWALVGVVAIFGVLMAF